MVTSEEELGGSAKDAMIRFWRKGSDQIACSVGKAIERREERNGDVDGDSGCTVRADECERSWSSGTAETISPTPVGVFWNVGQKAGDIFEEGRIFGVG